MSGGFAEPGGEMACVEDGAAVFVQDLVQVPSVIVAEAMLPMLSQQELIELPQGLGEPVGSRRESSQHRIGGRRHRQARRSCGGTVEVSDALTKVVDDLLGRSVIFGGCSEVVTVMGHAHAPCGVVFLRLVQG
ncbi:hypothetical protein E1285_23695 [Actinomadura sp. 7K507]|nr:hypothetical protein E1285_23695 [Actinomadura sp. 7K507]